ncbi:MAG: ABC transporter ATP-binding protein [Macellibacteroides fermentans]|jgi:ABC-2 type transport system ATP-binding protein|uniref:ABC transporter ATP-binding protein n=1 Tax=Macellibacteroides fermentans TaxID=879969 RepID=UPI000AF0A2D9|nr:ATP-binding cassette domain-containing protein [Parabacteroides sp.]MDT3367615.1 ATP-binding cassette domain-containing protein [Bacteroidota bacterium]HAD02986.1 ABC transporter ATP-binding protein [Porphyromonadaceae bacterium]HNP91316.1 ATP-binding cassette domain-containing protein [Macellibacteroides fermentans]HRG12279.1 ATP-binding cassette domain-containing protein [Macellibacteroides fermentans]
MNFLETNDVVKQYANHLALNKVSIQVPQGKVFGLLGPNGAGKTTLIRIINRITAPDSGSVLFNGRPSMQEDIFKIGYLPEERGLYKKMKVGEQALYLAQLKGLDYFEAKKRLTHWFEKFEIMPWWNKKVEELSKGMQQKVQFVITVIHNPELLIFDEPFSGFDPVNADLLKKEILELKDAGHTIIFSTHNMSSVEEICDEIALIDHAQVVLSGHVTEVRERFRTNTFKIKLKGTALLSSADQYSILSQKQGQNSLEVLLRKSNDVSNAELLMSILKQNEIIAFTEELPSMNEIFINTVAGKNKPQI